MPNLTNDPRLSKLFEFDVTSEAVTPIIAAKAANSNVAFTMHKHFTTASAPKMQHWVPYVEAFGAVSIDARSAVL